MYGSRSREMNRQAIRHNERTNAAEYIKRSYNELQTQRGMLPQMREALEDIVKRMKTCRGPTDIRTYMRLKGECEVLQRKIERVVEGSDTRQFFQRAQPLLMQCETAVDHELSQRREALAMAMFHPEKAVPVFVQTNRCSGCQTDMKVQSEESIMVCPGCKTTRPYLQLATDHVDCDYYAQDTHAHHNRITCAGNLDSMTTQDDSGYPKPSLLRKYLYQFSETVPDAPSEVVEVILRKLSQVHIQGRHKAQPTPIGNILKQHGLKEYSWMSSRIAMDISRQPHQPKATMSKALIERIIERFELMLAALKQKNCRKRSKVFNFKFITRVFLQMEGEFALSELFDNHKTRAVLNREDRRLHQSCKILDSEMASNGFSWKFFRSL